MVIVKEIVKRNTVFLNINFFYFSNYYFLLIFLIIYKKIILRSQAPKFSIYRRRRLPAAE